MYARTSLTPRGAKLLIRYFDGADDVITARLTSGFSPHEDHLTSLLFEMLDDNLAASIQIEAKKYPPHIERRLTSSDLGIVIDYRDNFNAQTSFQKGAMFRAKKVYGNPHRRKYSLSNCFDELDPEQLRRPLDMANDQSLFYCPRVEAYDEPSQEEVWHHVIPSGPRLYRYFWKLGLFGFLCRQRRNHQ
jgi:hypothetical protein